MFETAEASRSKGHKKADNNNIDMIGGELKDAIRQTERKNGKAPQCTEDGNFLCGGLMGSKTLTCMILVLRLLSTPEKQGKPQDSPNATTVTGAISRPLGPVATYVSERTLQIAKDGAKVGRCANYPISGLALPRPVGFCTNCLSNMHWIRQCDTVNDTQPVQ